MKAQIYDQIKTLVEIPLESSDAIAPKGVRGAIVECYDNPEMYAVDLAIRDRRFAGGLAYHNLVLTPDQFEVVKETSTVIVAGHSALDIAKYFITLPSPEQEDCITNLKLQKLLYYAQGFHLAMFDKPLFPEPVEAWKLGPVVPEIYQIYKQYQSAFIPQPEHFNPEKYEKKIQELLDEIYQRYGKYTAPALMDLTHQETPWKETSIGEEIPHSLMKTYFETQLVK